MPVAATGRTWQHKVEIIRAAIKKADCEGLVITMLDEVAWLFNLRGSDIPYNPLFFAYCYVGSSSIKLFMNSTQATEDVRLHLTGVDICDYDDTKEYLTRYTTGCTSVMEAD